MTSATTTSTIPLPFMAALPVMLPKPDGDQDSVTAEPVPKSQDENGKSSSESKPLTYKQVNDLFKDPIDKPLKQLDNSQVAMLLTEKKVDSYSKPRALKDIEYDSLAQGLSRDRAPMYPSLGNRLTDLMQSADQSALDNGHFYGALGSIFGGTVWPWVKYYPQTLTDLGRSVTGALGHIWGGVGDFFRDVNRMIPDWGHAHATAGDHIEGALLVGLGLGIPMAVTSYWHQNQQNESLQELMQRYRENPTLLDVYRDEKNHKQRDVWGKDPNVLDDNLWRKLTNPFRRNEPAVPNVLRNLDRSWFKPWPMLPFVTSTFKGVPLANQVHQMVDAAYTGDYNKMPSAVQIYTEPSAAVHYAYKEAGDAYNAVKSVGKEVGDVAGYISTTAAGLTTGTIGAVEGVRALRNDLLTDGWQQTTVNRARDWYNAHRPNPPSPDLNNHQRAAYNNLQTVQLVEEQLLSELANQRDNLSTANDADASRYRQEIARITRQLSKANELKQRYQTEWNVVRPPRWRPARPPEVSTVEPPAVEVNHPQTNEPDESDIARQAEATVQVIPQHQAEQAAGQQQAGRTMQNPQPATRPRYPSQNAQQVTSRTPVERKQDEIAAIHEEVNRVRQMQTSRYIDLISELDQYQGRALTQPEQTHLDRLNQQIEELSSRRQSNEQAWSNYLSRLNQELSELQRRSTSSIPPGA